MSIASRLKKIENKTHIKHKELVYVDVYWGYEGRYFIEKDGKDVEIKDLEKAFPGKQVIRLLSYSKPNI